MTAYARIDGMLSSGRCVLLDGGVGSEVVPGDWEPGEPWAIYEDEARVLDVHRRYAAAGCDVVSTHTWGILSSIGSERGRRPGRTGLPAWTVAARDAVNLARQGIAAAGRAEECAVAFCLNDADPALAGSQDLLGLLWSADPPDLVLVETLPTHPTPALRRAIAAVAGSGLPVWASFRPEPGETHFAAEFSRPVLGELEQAGVRAVLVNCLAPERISAALDDLMESSALPVGCYPRLEPGADPGPAGFAGLAAEWWARGARIVGGCCGVGPEHLKAVADALDVLTSDV